MSLTNTEADRAYKHTWYVANRDRVLLRARRLHEKSPERRKCQRAASLANKRYPGPRLTAVDVAEIIESSGRKCHWCRKENLSGGDLTLEHLKPINEREYLVIACLSCNGARLHSTAGVRKTDQEKLAKQRAGELKYQIRNAEIDRIRKALYYLRNTDQVRKKAAERYRQYREQILDGLRQRYASDPEFKQSMKMRVREWEQENPERMKQLKREWYKREKVKQNALLQIP